MDEAYAYHGGPAETQENAEYEKKINTGGRVDVDKFLNARSQDSVERTQRAERMAEERMHQEQEQLDKLRYASLAEKSSSLDVLFPSKLMITTFTPCTTHRSSIFSQC